MKQILIIDDDENLGELLTQYLARYEMQAHVALAPSKGLEMIKKLKPDLLILDVMLPEKDGFEVCREIRAKVVDLWPAPYSHAYRPRRGYRPHRWARARRR